VGREDEGERKPTNDEIKPKQSSKSSAFLVSTLLCSETLSSAHLFPNLLQLHAHLEPPCSTMQTRLSPVLYRALYLWEGGGLELEDGLVGRWRRREGSKVGHQLGEGDVACFELDLLDEMGEGSVAEL